MHRLKLEQTIKRSSCSKKIQLSGYYSSIFFLGGGFLFAVNADAESVVPSFSLTQILCLDTDLLDSIQYF
jgi:hypothetical protein